MNRRELTGKLLATTAASPLLKPVSPTPPEAAAPLRFGPNDGEKLRAAGREHVSIALDDGDYVLTDKLLILFQITLAGSSRNNTVLRLGTDADYVIEIGDGHQGPNAGALHRLRFYGREGSHGCVHLNQLSHMWLLNELIFSGGRCPALVVDNCWDSNYTNIDIFAHFIAGAPADQGASVMCRKGAGNIYFRGLRVEGALSGGLYLEEGPIYVVEGKIDNGFGGPQSAAAITIDANGFLSLDNFYLGGMREQFSIDSQGALRLGRVTLDGGTATPAAINDRRNWRHRGPAHFEHPSTAWIGPLLPLLDLGVAEFHRFHPSVESETPAAVFSRIHPIRQVRNLRTVANGTHTEDSRLVGTNAASTQNHQFKGCYLVHNRSGTVCSDSDGARRPILDSFIGGNLLLRGVEPVRLDDEWSIEYCAGHCTPLQCANVVLRSCSLFSVLLAGVRIGSEPQYIFDPRHPAYGTTLFRLMAAEVPMRNLTGLFLIDERSGEPFYIEYGLDHEGAIGVMYDRRVVLASERTFSVVAGYDAAVRTEGAAAIWTHGGVRHRMLLSDLQRAGYSPEQLPLWGFGARSRELGLERPPITRSPSAPTVAIDLSAGDEFEISVVSGGTLTIAIPANQSPHAGRRITLTLRNQGPTPLAATQWSGGYRLAPWIDPAPGFSRSITFRYDGHHWVEVGRTQADVPN